MQIWYVHGAGASELSFNWLQHQLPAHEARFFTYDQHEPVLTSAARLCKLITEPSIILGHSLGGVIAAICAEKASVQKLVTICAPFGGVRYADFMAMFSFEPMFLDLRQHGWLLSSLRATKNTKPHLAIVGTQGLPWIAEQNDGVVTVASQTALPGPRYETLPLNHFEVLLSVDVANLITDFI